MKTSIGDKLFPPKFIASVIFPVKEGKVCMAIKTRGVGKNKRNGYGGGLEEGENMLGCTIRELREEACVETDVASIKKVGFIKIRNLNADGSHNFTCHLHVILLTSWTGEFAETDEMLDPKWFPVSDLPVSDMMPADLIWVPRILAGESLRGEFSCGPEQVLVGEAILEPCTFGDQDLEAS